MKAVLGIDAAWIKGQRYGVALAVETFGVGVSVRLHSAISSFSDYSDRVGNGSSLIAPR